MKKRAAYYFLVGVMLILSMSTTAYSCKKHERDTTPINPIDTTKDTTALKRDVEVWMTRPDKSALLRHQVIALTFDTIVNSYPDIEVDTTRTYQAIDGFGFAMTGGSAYLINRLQSDQREALIRELFSSDSGCIGISYIRVSIGASDLSATVFSYDDIPSGTTDTTLSSFTLAKEQEDLIPVLKTALKYNPQLKILGSPWSAPTWMKTNGNSIGGKLKTEYYGVYSRYFVKYIQGMKSEGIPIDAITIQNEPLNPNNNPSMEMSSAEQGNFIKNYLGPAFQDANITTKIILYDHNCDHPEYPINILNDLNTRQYVDGSGFHLYAGDISALTQTHFAHPDKNVYFTEQWVGGPSNFGPDMQWHMKNLIIGATRNWSKNVIEWNLASDPYYKPHTPGGCNSCEGALTIASSVARNVSYYIIAHASKFVFSGSKRIASSYPANLPNVAFKRPDGKKVLIVLNESSSTQSFNIKYGRKSAKTKLDKGVVATYIW
ncbi:MAG: glucosylceramidase [Bacteroidetes bacterium]|nr:glucosylceramidase [Bacteroidota bacterium]